VNGFIKRIAALAAAVILLNVPDVFAAGPAFPDTAGHWAESYIQALLDRHVISGMGDGLFHPDLPVTTAQFVAMVMQSAVGYVAPTNGYWASGYLDKAYGLEIINGGDLEEADKPLIRRFAARIGNNALNKLWNEADEQDISVAEHKLRDLYTCHECVWTTAQFYVKGIMIGSPDNNFRGDDNFTRAEAAVVMMRMIDPSLRVPPKLDLPAAADDGKISPDQAQEMLKTYSNVMMVDVRTPEAHAAGFIPGSVNIPLDDILNNISATQIPEDKSAIIIVYCQKGVLSLKAYHALVDDGYTNVYNLGGIDGWPYDIASTD